MDDFAQRILDKNKLITDLEKKIKSAPGFNSSTETARKSLEELSKLKILTNDDWDKFQMNYNKIFPGIIKSVLTASPELTEAELRMFLLIKLGISIREVATVLGISQESVRKTRYRMRKKLNIGEYDDLDEFVKNFRPPEVSQVQPSS
jgi:DNA-binding CsgD family transcriptional regulator